MEDDSGSTRSYANDLAVLELTADVRMSNSIMPVCIDWITQFTVQNGLIGKVNQLIVFKLNPHSV